MKTNIVLALVSVGALCLLGPIPAQARGGGGGHSANSAPHAANQNQPAAAASKTAKKKGNKEEYLKVEMRDATISSAAKRKSGKVSIKSININKRMDKASP